MNDQRYTLGLVYHVKDYTHTNRKTSKRCPSQLGQCFAAKELFRNAFFTGNLVVILNSFLLPPAEERPDQGAEQFEIRERRRLPDPAVGEPKQPEPQQQQRQ